MKIGVDMDSVLAEIMQPMVDFHNDRYHTNLTVNDHTDYNLSNIWKCDPSDVLFRIFEYYDSPYFDKVQPIVGAIEGIDYLANKYDLVLITSRPHKIEEKTNSWLLKFFPHKFKKVCHTNQVSHRHEKRKKKSQVCKEEGISILIDDAIDYALDCANENIQVYLFPALWNKNPPKHSLIRPVLGWEEITKIL